MVKFVAIHKLGNTETAQLDTIDILYKQCKFRKKKDFEKRHSWAMMMNKTKIYVTLFSKDSGNHKSINKYELPPPLDKDLFYGCMAIVASKDKEVEDRIHLTKEMWDKIYEKLMGGFADLDKEEDVASEDEYIPVEFQTKQGYSKEDNFIVDDDNVEYITSSTGDSEDEYHFTDEDTQSDNNSYNGDDEEEKKTDGNKPDSGDNSKGEKESTEDEREKKGEDELTDTDSELSEENYVKEN